jgi:hypothetical protein
MSDCTCFKGHLSEHRNGICPCTTPVFDCPTHGIHGLRRLYWQTRLPWWFSRTHWRYRRNQLASIITRNR